VQTRFSASTGCLWDLTVRQRPAPACGRVPRKAQLSWCGDPVISPLNQLFTDMRTIVDLDRCFPVKLMIIDDAVGIQGNGNQGTVQQPHPGAVTARFDVS